jgi:peptide/nickel transport system permease protein
MSTTASARRGGTWLLREMRSDKAGFLGVLILGAFVVVAVLAPWIAPHVPDQTSVNQKLLPPIWNGGDAQHLLGTDALGRDMLSRLIAGSRTSMIVGLSVVVLAGVPGTIIGVVAGYFGGVLDYVVSRWVEIQGTFPVLLLALLILAVVRPGITSVVVVLAVERWAYFVRVARGEVLSRRRSESVENAELIGCGSVRVMTRHVLPALVGPILTLAVLEFAHVILAEAALSYLGLGIQPPTVSWGLMVAEGQGYIFDSWWVVTFPGLVILLLVLGLNLTGRWVLGLLDPNSRQGKPALATTNLVTEASHG